MAENQPPNNAAEWAQRAEEDLAGLSDDLRFIVEEILDPLVQGQNERQWGEDARVVYEAAGRLSRAANVAADIGGIWDYLQSEVQRGPEPATAPPTNTTH